MLYDAVEWLHRYRYVWLLAIVAYFVALFLVKRKTGLQGWRRMVPGNILPGIYWIVGGALRGFGFVAKKVPWKPILIWGPWLVVGLILAFYGIENWRGARAWEKVRSDWVARGETLNVAEFMPEPIPDEENFVKHPVVLAEMGGSKLSRMGGGRGLEALGFEPSRGALRNGNPSVGRASDVRLWFFPSRRKGEETAAAVEALKLFDPVLNEMEGLAEAVRRPGCDFGQERGHGHVWDRWGNPSAYFIMDWMAAFNCRALARIRTGAGEQALVDLETSLYLTLKLGADPTPTGFGIAGASIDWIAEIVWEGLLEQVWSEEELNRLEDILQELDFLKQGLLSVRCMAVQQMNLVEEVANDRGLIASDFDYFGRLMGGGPAWWNDLVNKMDGGTAYLIPRGWFDLGLADVIGRLDRVMLQPNGVKVERLAGAMVLVMEKEVWEIEETWAGDFRGGFLREFAGVASIAVSAQAELDRARVAVGLERYRMRTGGYPEHLGELVPREMAALPVDLVTGEALRYRVKEDGTPVVWSVGFNGKDDGGVPARALDDLDWVWQYTGTKGQTEGDWSLGRK